MILSVKDIYDLASCSYTVSENIIYNGDTFVLLSFSLSDRYHIYHLDYGVCSNYSLKSEDKIAMSYLSLAKFPPEPKILDLTANEVLKSKFISPDRKSEIQIKRVNDLFKIKRAEIVPTVNMVPFRRSPEVSMAI